MAIDRAMDQTVRTRARRLCEYCHAIQLLYPKRFQIDHVVAQQHGGPTSLENLALCCVECNRRKGPNRSEIDPVSIAVLDINRIPRVIVRETLILEALFPPPEDRVESK